MTQLLAINVGELEPVPGAARPSGIYKKTVRGPVALTPDGLTGDHIGSVKYHGGPDQALCLYSAQDYAWWKGELGRPLTPGTFGENLTVSDFGKRPPRIGDIWKIGTATVQLCAPRIPCVTLAKRMGDPGFVKRFAQARRGGAYARVLHTGNLEAGMEIRIQRSADGAPTIDELFDLCLRRPRDPDRLRRALAYPVASLLRADLRKWLEKSEVKV
jgi:MOSC domain-containing protein YiiM